MALTNTPPGPMLYPCRQVFPMNRQGFHSHPSLATPLVGLSLLTLFFFVLFAGGAYQASYGTTPDVRFIAELEHLAVATVGERTRVHHLTDDERSSPDEDSEVPSWLADAGHCLVPTLPRDNISLAGTHSGTASCGRLLRPPSRAPPSA